MSSFYKGGEHIVKSRMGEIKGNNFGTLMKIVGWRIASDIDVQFLDEHRYVKEHVLYSAFKKGEVKNPYDKTVMGVGYLGVGNHKTGVMKGKPNPIYDVWKDMLARCYREKVRHLHPAYYGKCTVCEEWLNFQVFAEWYVKHWYKVNERLHLDKDIINPKSKLYSHDTCLLVPQRINELFHYRVNKDGLPNGIRLTSNGKYSASWRGKSLGTYLSLEDAYRKYAEEKEFTIKKVANEYKNIIPLKLYESLIRYQVLIENDPYYITA